MYGQVPRAVDSDTRSAASGLEQCVNAFALSLIGNHRLSC